MNRIELQGNNPQNHAEIMKSLSRKRLLGEILSELGREKRMDLFFNYVTKHLDNPIPQKRSKLAKKLLEVFLTPQLAKDGIEHLWEIVQAKVPEEEKGLVFEAINENVKK